MQSNASFGEAVKAALDSLRASKLRSFLTLLGIILATTTLIAVMSLINGMNLYIAQTVSNMGADGFRVVRMAFIGDWDPKKFLEFQRRNPQLSTEEFEFLEAKATMVKQLGMQTFRQTRASFANENLDGVSLQGGSPNVGEINNVQIANGRFFTPGENQRHSAVAVIGEDLRTQFFPNVDPVGKTILVGSRPFEVVGVAKPLGSVFGQSRDTFVMIPIETYFKMFGARMGIQYALVAVDHEHLMQAQDEIRMLLRAWRKLNPKQDDTFSVISSDSFASAWEKMTGAIAATAVAVVSVFMVVGGVVIMNIMLAVVTERTREIGIRKAIGARRTDILRQFLVESSVLSAMGGVIGVGLAWMAAIAVRSFTPVPMAMPLFAVVTAVVLSAAVGLFFGIYPASRAAKLDPIEALRAEN